MVSERKREEVKRIRELMERYPVIGVLDLFKMPSRQLQLVRKSLRGEAVITMPKKRLMGLAFKGVKTKKDLEKLSELEPQVPALVFTEMNPFELHEKFEKSKFPGYAKENDIAPEDIVIPAGPTKLPAGPAIGDLQRLKIPAMVKEGKIHVRKDTTLVKEGETISGEVANLLKKLDVQPMEIGINLLGAWESGLIFRRDLLSMTKERFIEDVREGHIYALNLSVNIRYPNAESIKILMGKAHREAKNLGVNAKILDEGVIEDLVSKARIQAQSLGVKLNV